MASFSHRFSVTVIVVILAILLAGFALYWFGFYKRADKSSTLRNVEAEQEPVPVVQEEELSDKTTLFGTMLAFNTNEGLKGEPDKGALFMEGWSTLQADESAAKDFFSTLESALPKNFELVIQSKFSSNRDVVGAFVWNVIEPVMGEYDWSIPDVTLTAAGQAGIQLSAVVHPFATWDQTEITAEEYKENCKAIDFGYYDYKAGPVNDWEAYEAFLAATVERYDGDGEADMPGLTTRVEAWEIGNEYDGLCGGYYGNPEGYVELLKRSYTVIKNVDPNALVLNAGSLEIIGTGTRPDETKAFWKVFFEQGADAYLDVFNFHYNSERRGADKSPEIWIEHLAFFNELMEGSQGRKPIWVTEFGTYSGTPNLSLPEQPGSVGRSLPTQSEGFQSSWYFRYAILGFSQGVERIFVDLKGIDMGSIGASSLFHLGGAQDGEPRPFLTTLQTIAATLEGFDTVEEIASGQYLFSVDGQKVYALWEGDLPTALQNKTVRAVGIDGEETLLPSSNLSYSVDAPLLVSELRD